MVEHGFHHVPVVDGDTPIGIITTSDFAAYVSSPNTPSP
jgi:CBS domain-containing protein